MRMKTILAVSAAALMLAGCQKANVRQAQAQVKRENVDLIWKGGNVWKVKLNGGHEQNPNSAESALGKDGGPAIFVVDIHGNTPATFKDPGGLTVWENSKSAPQSGSTQIAGPAVMNDGKRLVFFDLNYGDHVKIFYSLNLSDGTTIDPIIDNGGGTWQ